MPAQAAVLRARETEPAVTNMELFFDLVYVFAVTQLSHRLLDHLSWRGAVETLVLFAAVWWAWNLTAWATNWIDPDQLPVRLLLIVLMLFGLVMSAAIPEAFAGQGWSFAGAYVALQLVRTGFVMWAFRGEVMGRNAAQLWVWSAVAGALWLAGAAAGGDTRLLVWALAVLVDWAGPLAGFWVPVSGRTPMHDWDLTPAHLAERCQLVVIIALGESILVTGLGFSELERTAQTVAAFVVAFAGSAALWWVYFARHAAAALERVARHDDPARLARGGYAYAHALCVAGVIVTAVGDELVITHPGGDANAVTALTVAGGAALYLVGVVLFVAVTGGFDRFELRTVAAGLAVFAAIGALTPLLSPLGVSVAVTAVLLCLVAAAALRAVRAGRPAQA
jgi:low temperature requirement protein LtrA